jgi:hypothetical protein
MTSQESPVKEQVNAPSACDMIDSTDDFAAYAPLGDCLKKCNDALASTYDAADKAALRHQKYHRRLTNFAVIAGTLAVLLAILQLTGFVPTHLPMWMEVFAAVIALCAVVLGLIQSRQTSWLLQRHKAEQCRLLKFRMLIDPDYWAVDAEQTRSWTDRLHRRIHTIREMTPRQLREWMENRDVLQAPSGVSRCALADDVLRALIGYFKDKRLHVQMAYFNKRANQYHGIDRYLRNVPPLLFFLSILVVFAHFTLDAVAESGNGIHGISIVLVALAVSLPVLGAGIRSIRSAHEFARSASLYRAKYEALKRIADRLEEEADCEQILRTLWHCEQFLEAEHREWLRLMSEAEWFG